VLAEASGEYQRLKRPRKAGYWLLPGVLAIASGCHGLRDKVRTVTVPRVALWATWRDWRMDPGRVLLVWNVSMGRPQTNPCHGRPFGQSGGMGRWEPVGSPNVGGLPLGTWTISVPCVALWAVWRHGRSGPGGALLMWNVYPNKPRLTPLIRTDLPASRRCRRDRP
jgi:hypothetical protein